MVGYCRGISAVFPFHLKFETLKRDARGSSDLWKDQNKTTAVL